MKIRAYAKVLLYIDTDQVDEKNITKKNKQMRKVAETVMRGCRMSATFYNVNTKLTHTDPWEIMSVEELS